MGKLTKKESMDLFFALQGEEDKVFKSMPPRAGGGGGEPRERARRQALIRMMGMPDELQRSLGIGEEEIFASMGHDIGSQVEVNDRFGGSAPDISRTRVFPVDIEGLLGRANVGNGVGEMGFSFDERNLSLDQGQAVIFGRQGLSDTTVAHELRHVEGANEFVAQMQDAMTARDEDEWKEAVTGYRLRLKGQGKKVSFKRAEEILIEQIKEKEPLHQILRAVAGKSEIESRWRGVEKQRVGEEAERAMLLRALEGG